MWTKVLTAAALIAGTIAPGATASPPPPVPELRGSNLISATESGFVYVRLPRPVRPDVEVGPNESWPVWAYGNGRVIAFMLVPDRAGAKPLMYGWRMGRCNEPRCKPSPDFGSTWWFSKPTLPAGDYRLYVVADGEAHVRLRFRELRGSTRLNAGIPANAQIETLTPQADVAPGKLYWAGAEAREAGRGFSLVGLYVDAPEGGQARGARGLCVYDETDSPGEDVAYVPPCPRAFNPVDPMVATWNEGAYYNPEEIVPAMGAWFANAAELRDAGAFALWLRY